MSGSPHQASEAKVQRSFGFSFGAASTAACSRTGSRLSTRSFCSLPTLLAGSRFPSERTDKTAKEAPRDLEGGAAAERSPQTPASTWDVQSADRPVSACNTMSNITKVAGIFFWDPQSRRLAALLFGILLALMVVDTLCMAWLSTVFAELSNTLIAHQAEAFWAVVKKVMCFMGFYLPFTSMETWVRGTFALEWRRSITRQLLKGYIGDEQSFFHLKSSSKGIDNPDQRIGQDVNDFTESASEVFHTLVGAVMKLCVMSGILARISGKLFLYLGVGSAVTTVVFLKVFGGPLMRVQRRVLSREATLRFALMRVRENAESIAFYQGAQFEQMRVGEIFDRVMYAMYRRLNVFVAFIGAQRLVFLLSQVIPTLVIGPRFLRGEIEFGAIAQTNMLFSILLQSMTAIVAQLGTLTNMGAQAVRVQQLRAALEETRRARGRAEAGGAYEPGPLEESIALEDVEGSISLELAALTLRVPGTSGGCPLISNLTLTLRRGESVLVCGESGVGKSSLLRAIGGLWDSGSGTISRCAVRRSIFVPQDSYLCLGSLRENATYPSTAEQRKALSDADVLSALEAVNLAYLPARYGLDDEVDLEGALSGGEKQRLGFARLLLRPKPLDFAILDEATSALDESNEARMYGLLREAVGSYASVGHRAQLRKFHTHSLLLEHLPHGGTGATFLPIEGASCPTPAPPPGDEEAMQQVQV